MITQSLDGTWKLKCLGEERTVDARVPGSVLSALLAANRIPDPYWRMEEYPVRDLFRQDYVYRLEFEPAAEVLAQPHIELVCSGLDTIAELSLNGRPLGTADNMHCTWTYDVKNNLREGVNSLEIIFRSPLKYMDDARAACADTITYVPTGGMPGSNFIRKAHSMFGWDWGPQLPDAGIWRDIALQAGPGAKLEDVLILQNHEVQDHKMHDPAAQDHKVQDYKVQDYKVQDPAAQDPKVQGQKMQDYAAQDHEVQEHKMQDLTAQDPAAQDRAVNAVRLTVQACIANADHLDDEYTVHVRLIGPDGSSLEGGAQVRDGRAAVELHIQNPQLWWPSGYGEQPLYRLETSLRLKGRTVEAVDERVHTIGLRTLTVSTERDAYGEEFAFVVNGVKIFAMGADYIPEDSVLDRVNAGRTERLIADCVKANFNCIRVWGGGYYPDDFFYDSCDRHGLIVWQDLMFACNVYSLSEDFERNIRQEADENVRRIRHHASLGLWCGNNEMEMGWCEWPKVTGHSDKLKADYIKQFEYVLPKVVRNADPVTFYWASSPSSGVCFDRPNDENRGDVHYWDVWHGMKPFTDYRNYDFRFCSEFGFQSFPSLKTVESFTLPEDRNIFSPVMESHQKNGEANGKIMYYLSSYYRYPKDFDSLLYVSQLLQAEAIRCGVEHWRRHRGRCMGAIYWQLNDCWPVASWASIDYFGRWKALHYEAKRFYAPKMLTAVNEGYAVTLHLHNESRTPLSAQVRVRLADTDFRVLEERTADVQIEALSAAPVLTCDFTERMAVAALRDDKVFAAYELILDGQKVSGGSLLFVRPKQFEFPQCSYGVQVEESETGESFKIHVTSDRYAQYVELSLLTMDAVFSDNYFSITDLVGVLVEIPKRELPAGITAAALQSDLRVRSIRDTFE